MFNSLSLLVNSTNNIHEDVYLQGKQQVGVKCV